MTVKPMEYHRIPLLVNCGDTVSTVCFSEAIINPFTITGGSASGDNLKRQIPGHNQSCLRKEVEGRHSQYHNNDQECCLPSLRYKRLVFGGDHAHNHLCAEE